MYEIEVTRVAEKQLKALPKADAYRVYKKIAELATDPRPDGCKKLEGIDHSYRIRQGDWRVVYNIEESRLLILVLKVAHRREVYQKRL